jgi:hypothetical protein
MSEKTTTATGVIEARPRKGKPVNVVYFIQGVPDGLIKIGWTSDLDSRFKTLCQGSPCELALLGIAHGGEREEQILHANFAEHRVRGEWFTPNPRLIEFAKIPLTERGPISLDVGRRLGRYRTIHSTLDTEVMSELSQISDGTLAEKIRKIEGLLDSLDRLWERSRRAEQMVQRVDGIEAKVDYLLRVMPQVMLENPDLAVLVQEWPSLPKSSRAAVLEFALGSR